MLGFLPVLSCITTHRVKRVWGHGSPVDVQVSHRKRSRVCGARPALCLRMVTRRSLCDRAPDDVITMSCGHDDVSTTSWDDDVSTKLLVMINN